MKSSSSPFQLPPERLEQLRADLKAYFLDEMDIEISTFQTDSLIEFLQEQVGKHFYNQGVSETIQAVKDNADDLVMLLKE